MLAMRFSIVFTAAALSACAGLSRAEIAIEADNDRELRDALAATSGSVTIDLAAGIHRVDRPIRITGRSVTIRGDAGAVLDGGDLDGTDPIVTVRGGPLDAPATSASFQGLVFRQSTRTDNPGGRSAGGAAIDARDADLNIIGCRFENNRAPRGGSIAIESGNLRMRGGSFTDSIARTHGGAIHAENAQRIDIAGTRFFDCEANETGGAIALINVGDANIRNTRFHGTRAARGGAIALDEVSKATIAHTAFAGTHAETDGGAVYAGRTWLTIDHSTVSGARAANGGAFAASDGTALALFHVTLSENTAAQGSDLSFGPGGIGIIENAIIWSGTNAIHADPAAVVHADHAIIRGGFDGLGLRIIDANPRFANPLGRDGIPGTGDESFTLLPGSPAIDVGSNAAWVGPRRAGLESRLHQDRETPDLGIADGLLAVVDLGPIEFTGSSLTHAATGDFAAPFGMIDQHDLKVLITLIDRGAASADIAEPFGVLDSGDVLALARQIAEQRRINRNP